LLLDHGPSDGVTITVIYFVHRDVISIKITIGVSRAAAPASAAALRAPSSLNARRRSSSQTGAKPLNVALD